MFVPSHVISSNLSTRDSLRLSLIVAVFCLPVGQVPSSYAAQTTAIWKGGAGTYTSTSNWDIGILPNNDSTTTYHLIVDQNPGTFSSVSLNTSPTIDSLTIDSGDTFVIENARILRVVGTAVTNAGTLAVRSAGSVTILRLDNSITLSGGGKLSLLAENLAELLSAAANASLTNQDNIIRGQGRLGLNSMQIVNQFTIQADSPGRILDIDPNANGLFNSGLLVATNRGILQCSNGEYNNVAGVICAMNDSEIRLSNASVLGGTLVVEPGGTLSITGDTTLQNIDLQMGGRFNVPFGMTVHILGQTYTQTNGTTELDGDLHVSTHGYELFDGTLQGTGTVVGSVTNRSGKVDPGSSVGKLTISGDYLQDQEGSVHMTLGGTTQGTTHDFLNVQGTAVLNGMLEIGLHSDFVPRDGDSFIILEAMFLSGAFHTIETHLNPDQVFSVTYTNHQVIAHFSQPEVDLSLSLAASANEVEVGAMLVYTATVANANRSQTSSAFLDIGLPDGFTYVGSNCMESNGLVSCGLAPIPGLGSTEIVLEVIAGGTVTHAATTGIVTTTTFDKNLANNQASIHTTIIMDDHDNDGVPDHVDSDDDGDGIDDDFERSHGLDPLDGSDAVLDHDHDGFSNLEEFIAGTRPLDRDDFLHILSIQSTPGFSIFFESHSNRLYSLLYSDDLTMGRWTPVPGQTDVFFPEGVHVWTDNTVTNNRVYRIDVKLP